MTRSITAAVVGALGAAIGSFGSITTENSRSMRTGGGKTRNIRSKIDWLEVVSFALCGSLFGGPLGYYWYVPLGLTSFCAIVTLN